MATEELKALEIQGLSELAACSDEAAVRAWFGKFLGEKGLWKAAFGKMNAVPKDQKAAFGAEGNRVKAALTAAYEKAHAEAKERALQLSLTTNPLDVMLPGRARGRGRLHPLTQAQRHVTAIFAELGFQVCRTREVETEEMNFAALNVPGGHPTRHSHSPFVTTVPGVLLRTHTSAGQVSVMREAAGKPIRALLTGPCYRNHAELQFEQTDGLVVGESVTMADLKGTIAAFARRMFGAERPVRIRSGYFPFTEPSIAVDIEHAKADSGWVELLGAGMVHPNVLRAGGYDPDQVTGFAFGLTLERVLMLTHDIGDARLFRQNDLRFLKQF
jgi:phenylalanyl-tRNA synthetase alpha chain